MGLFQFGFTQTDRSFYQLQTLRYHIWRNKNGEGGWGVVVFNCHPRDTVKRSNMHRIIRFTPTEKITKGVSIEERDPWMSHKVGEVKCGNSLGT